MSSLNPWLKRAAVVVAAFAIAGGASPAFALSSNTAGAEAYGDSDGDWRVYDQACDSHSVYGNFVENGTSGTQRKNNSSGCNTVVSGDIGNAISAVQACRNIQLGTDNCGGWNEW